MIDYSKLHKSLLKSKLTVEEYYFLLLIYNSEIKTLIEYLSIKKYNVEFFQSLIDEDFIKPFKLDNIRISNIKLTHKFYELCMSENRRDIEDFYNSWIKLWPEGKNSAGYSYRSNKKDCIKKLSKFFQEYPFDKEVIMKCTENYINDRKSEGYSYMLLANNFVYHRDKGSMLAGLCENFDETVDRTDRDNNLTVI